ncbi:MAG TPA: ACT domain-containing protein [Opitutaceae bacterium]|nr:ACT domain-containing protein [Opitutaceae bacterium]
MNAEATTTSPSASLISPTAIGAGRAAKPPLPPTSRRATVLELRARNHPGTMSHITSLFARRAFNLEAIVCVPIADGRTSKLLLLVADEPRLEQVERQLEKLHDVLEVRHRADLGPEYFDRLV